MTRLNVLAIAPSAAQENLLRQQLALADQTDIRVFSQAADTLDYLHHHHADLLFTDLVLPDMRGFAFIRRLAGLRHKPALAVVSDQPGVLLDSKCMQARLSGLEIIAQLRKPLQPTDITNALEKVRGQLVQRRQLRTPEQYYFSREELLLALQQREIRASGDNCEQLNGTSNWIDNIEWRHPQLGKLQASQFRLAIELNGLQDAIRLSILNKPETLLAERHFHPLSQQRRSRLQPWQRACRSA